MEKSRTFSFFTLQSGRSGTVGPVEPGPRLLPSTITVPSNRGMNRKKRGKSLHGPTYFCQYSKILRFKILNRRRNRPGPDPGPHLDTPKAYHKLGQERKQLRVSQKSGWSVQYVQDGTVLDRKVHSQVDDHRSFGFQNCFSLRPGTTTFRSYRPGSESCTVE